MVRLEHLLAASEIVVEVLSLAEAGDPKPDLGPLDRGSREIWGSRWRNWVRRIKLGGAPSVRV